MFVVFANLIVPIGDGGEDISCRLESEHLALTSSDASDGSFSPEYVDTFLNKLKCFFLEGLVFPRTHMDSRFEMSVNNVPPFLLPSFRYK